MIRSLLILFFIVSIGATSPARDLIVQVDGVPELPVILATPESDWLVHKGNLPPLPGWEKMPYTALLTWNIAPGPFGYGDGPYGSELSDMKNGYSTFYLRKDFEITSEYEPYWRMKLLADFDDGFVAYLDGMEVLRVNAPATNGAPVAFNDVATLAREPGFPVEYDLGSATNLTVGTHALSIVGLNRAVDDDDFTLGVQLELRDSRGDSLYTLVHTNRAELSIFSLQPDATNVTANGEACNSAGESPGWKKSVELAPGMNSILFQAFAENGDLVAFARKDILFEAETTTPSGPLAGEVVWEPSRGVIRIGELMTLNAGAKLILQPGTVVLFSTNAGISGVNATVEVRGTAHQPVYLMPIESEISWEGVSVSGSNSLVNASHLDLRGSFLRVRSGGTCLVKDSTFRDFHRNYPIVFTDKAQFAELVRCHLARFYEVNFKQTLTQIDDCVFEYILGDGIDYDAPPFGSYMRNSTLRHGNRTNIDAMDIGEEADRTLIENCHVFDFSDKAVSIGEGSHGIIVKNSLFDQVETGVAVKDGCTAEMIGNTIVNSTYAFRLYEKNPPFGGGHATNTYNNILWNNLRGVVLSNGSTIVVHHSNIMGTTYPGEGNISADPLFRNFDWRDYRLGSGSPSKGTGLDGTNMGYEGPIGASWIDTDGDGIPDQWEMLHGLNPFNSRDALRDFDGDGQTNYQEYLLGKNPEVPDRDVIITAIAYSIDEVRIRTEGRKDHRYQLLRSLQLEDPDWVVLSEEGPLENDGTVVVKDLLQAAHNQAFYRVLELEQTPPPPPTGEE